MLLQVMPWVCPKFMRRNAKTQPSHAPANGGEAMLSTGCNDLGVLEKDGSAPSDGRPSAASLTVPHPDRGQPRGLVRIGRRLVTGLLTQGLEGGSDDVESVAAPGQEAGEPAFPNLGLEVP